MLYKYATCQIDMRKLCNGIQLISHLRIETATKDCCFIFILPAKVVKLLIRRYRKFGCWTVQLSLVSMSRFNILPFCNISHPHVPGWFIHGILQAGSYAQRGKYLLQETYKQVIHSRKSYRISDKQSQSCMSQILI